jgi:hypothetical protein
MTCILVRVEKKKCLGKILEWHPKAFELRLKGPGGLARIIIDDCKHASLVLESESVIVTSRRLSRLPTRKAEAAADESRRQLICERHFPPAQAGPARGIKSWYCTEQRCG